MILKIEYTSSEEKETLILLHADKTLVEEQITQSGNFLIFSTEISLGTFKKQLALIQQALDDLILGGI